MKTNKNFEDLLESLHDEECVGLGNPNAKILFINKEPGADIGSNIYHGFAKSWKDKKHDYNKRYTPEESNLKNLNHTWQRYQKLYEKILFNLDIRNEIAKTNKYEITFIENVFTTELSNLSAKNTSSAKKQTNFRIELEKRKSTFFKSDFIQQFPIVIIFANDNKYIETYSGEVCELFKVKFDNPYEYPGKDPIWLHSSINPQENNKLLIHTRQITNSISSDLIDSLSKIVANFIKKNSLNIFIS